MRKKMQTKLIENHILNFFSKNRQNRIVFDMNIIYLSSLSRSKSLDSFCNELHMS